MGTEVLKVDPARPSSAVLERALQVLNAGGVIAFPTETFYGLGAAALDARAVKQVFELKGRPWSKPLLVLVDSVAMAERVAMVGERARVLMARHWPGALTLVLPARPGLPAELTAGTVTVGLRLSPHPVATALVSGLGGPLTAPSANPSGAAAPATPAEVLSYFDGALGLLLDAGPTAGGLPSTVLDVTGDTPRVLRQGAVRL
ncbi:MAG TPA: L-threonylcarbamoyladenylate synthase [Methylomirabilota bacterium]|nr:L-threonylcarbamoyladenylate synthase [Methylomirabilota bacterium]